MDHQAFAQLLGNYGEFVGAVAVVATLAYLIIQIRQNNKLMIATIYESAMEGYRKTNNVVVENAEYASIARRALMDVSQLDEDETFRFNMGFRNYWNHIYKLYRLYETGVFPEAEWKIAGTEAAQLMRSGAGQAFRERNLYFSDLFTALDLMERSDVFSFGFDSPT